MSVTSSLMRLQMTRSLCGALVGLSLASIALGDTGSVRMGRYFLDSVGRRFDTLNSIQEVLEMLSLGTQLFVKDVRDCQGLIAVPPSREHGRDGSSFTYAVIQRIKVECWSVLQVRSGSAIAATGPNDRIGPEIVNGIMAQALNLSDRNEEWRKTLTAFQGGVLTCRDDEQCLLELPDGNDPADEAVEYELVLAQGDERFIRVTQLYRGQSGFIYGIHWREAPDGGEVVAIFPDLDATDAEN